MDNDISAFNKGVGYFAAVGSYSLFMFTAQYLSVKCAVLMHFSFTCINTYD